jgi:hypothetical protein
MGIEPTGAPLRKLENMGFRVTPTLKCDRRVNFRGTWDHVRIREPIPAATDGQLERDRRARPARLRSSPRLRHFGSSGVTENVRQYLARFAGASTRDPLDPHVRSVEEGFLGAST